MTHASSDNQGLICAFELGPVTPHDQDLLAATHIDRPHWLHLNLVDIRARRWIEGAGLPDEAREVLLEPAPLVHGQPPPESVGPMVTYAIAQDIELCQERTRLLQEEIAGRLGEATNRNLS
jgi:hypothetical protein